MKVGDALVIDALKLFKRLKDLAEFINFFIDSDGGVVRQIQRAGAGFLEGVHDLVFGYMEEDRVLMDADGDHMTGDIGVAQRQKVGQRVRDIRFSGMHYIVWQIGNRSVINLVRIQDKRCMIPHFFQMF